MKMKVMLLQDVRNLWQKWELLDVAPAYARNVLFRQNLAKEADANTIKEYEQRMKKKEKKQEENTKKISDIIDELKKWNFTIKRTAAPMWNLYDKVTSQILQAELVSQYGYKFDLKNILCDKIDKVWAFDFELVVDSKKIKFKGEVISE